MNESIDEACFKILKGRYVNFETISGMKKPTESVKKLRR